ncbi:MAG TPA: helix-turn-helix domain-containing protein [Candidatus Limnocylindrales bacterium]|nr:helix-turn-helix domain-containing protein [Candidatus Limnocylindrales bacterium]
MPTTTRNRRSLAVEDLDLARQVGARLKAARTRAGLTQKALAEPRYTKAYISALENGLIKPSMAALRFLARRLGTVPGEFLADEDTHWRRVEAELRLASGDWQAAADRFQAILDEDPAGLERGLSLLGLAEAMYRLGRPVETIATATEAQAILAASRHGNEARRATYWLAAAHHASDDPARARTLFEELLAAPAGVEMDPDLRVRTLVALATVATHSGDSKTAIGLLQEAKALGVDLDDRRRATLLHTLAYSHRLAGDLEVAIRTGIESLALFRAIDARGETASIDNELAMIYLGLGNLAEADRHAADARSGWEATGDTFLLPHVGDTQAQIALGRDDVGRAATLAADAVEEARRVGNGRAELSALLTGARAARRRGEVGEATSLLETAAALAEQGPAARLREVLTEWGELAAESGDHARAYELSRRALATH